MQGQSLNALWPGGYSETVLLVKQSDLERAQSFYDAFFEPQEGGNLPADADVPEELTDPTND